MLKLIQHTENAIVITIPTSCPAATHECLMRGITAGIRAHLIAEKEKADKDYIYNLVQLLEALLPHEKELDAAYG